MTLLKTYPEDSPIPNWPFPKYLSKRNFPIYCTPINDAIIRWLKELEETGLLKKFLSSEKENITDEEFEKIKKAYANIVDEILLKSWDERF